MLLEVGPGNALATAARQHPARGAGQAVLATLRHARERQGDLAFLLTALGRLWLAGAEVDWQGFHAGARRRRVALPTYPFERQRYWVEPTKVVADRGLALARHLARRQRARLVLVGRSALPPREEWEARLAAPSAGDEGDRTARRIRRLRELEELGAEVLAAAADVADRARMAEVLGRARARFGRLDGVFHAAGLPGGGLVQARGRDAARAVLAPKVDGTLVLRDLLREEPPDFLMLFSSVTSLLSQPGQADYCAANCFLDAFAQAAAARGAGPFTVAVNWDAWREVGMAAETAVPEELRAFRAESLAAGLSPAQGLEALERILAPGRRSWCRARTSSRGWPRASPRRRFRTWPRRTRPARCTRGRPWAAPSWARGASLSRRSRPSGRSCWASTGWAPTTTSSSWAATRWWASR